MNNFLQSYIEKLSKNFTYPEIELRALLKKTSIKKKDIFLNNFRIKDIDIKLFQQAFYRRIKNEPISKIFNSKSFWKYNFFVNEDVLDPRPETELIIEEVLRYYPKKDEPISVLDLCTGSGCLAISIAKEYPNSNVLATDISNKAIEIAKYNAQKLDCIKKIEFVNCDLLDQIKKFDIIVSNPPYLSNKDYKNTSDEIKLYEPKEALVASMEGYEYYVKIGKLLPRLLKKNSRFFVEIGHLQANKAINIFKLNDINCLKVAKDLQNLDRVLILNKT